ncbi:hypothetical protein [Lichenifustis flavocetrariae]|uniref:Uncharacterized protein n=1 Tax=Lichenifustis flavocetrariae TaxID=2949735 RepID=A0AA41ZBQ8_9HYPH|nr:hypothetical protein [Lichenifustis flavocetrariae]MCW6512957.1 hypothetical protein [Lichenifustis flavocetrariae]
MRAFTEALAARLEPALPGRIEVERRRDGLFSKTFHVRRISARFDDSLLVLEYDRGHLHAKRTKVVRGVSISTQDLSVPAWLDDIIRRTQAVGEGAGAAHAALHDFLMS